MRRELLKTNLISFPQLLSDEREAVGMQKKGARFGTIGKPAKEPEREKERIYGRDERALGTK